MKRPSRRSSKPRRATPRRHYQQIRRTDSRPPPPLVEGCALFLNIDSVLAELVARPGPVQGPLPLQQLVYALRRRLDGAVAIMTGRRLTDIDGVLAPALLPGAGLDGAELRLRFSGNFPASSGIGYGTLANALRTRLGGDDRLRVENRGATVRVTFADAPERRIECVRTMRELTCWCDDLAVVEGPGYIEARPADATRGQAVRTLMAQEPFAGRTPVYLGKDASDETGFLASEALGGYAVSIAEDIPGPYRLDPSKLQAWLLDALT